MLSTAHAIATVVHAVRRREARLDTDTLDAMERSPCDRRCFVLRGWSIVQVGRAHALPEASRRKFVRHAVSAGGESGFAGKPKKTGPPYRFSAGTDRLLAGRQKIVEIGCGTILFKEAREVIASSHR
jgi:hypothetical protein